MCFSFLKKKKNNINLLYDSSVNSIDISVNTQPEESNSIIVVSENPWINLKPLDISKIKCVNFSESQYYKTIVPKTQIVLHHTISGDGINGDINTWEDDPAVIATCIIIDRVGTPWQLFSSKYWAHHLGCKTSNNLELNRNSIGIEIDNWGGLILGDGTVKQFGKYKNGKPKLITTEPGRYYNYYGNVIYVNVQEYPEKFMGYQYFEKYSEAQIKTAGELLLLWHNKYNISLKYNEDMWDKSERALAGENGIWTHVSFRGNGKSDCHPDPDLIKMLKTLNEIK